MFFDAPMGSHAGVGAAHGIINGYEAMIERRMISCMHEPDVVLERERRAMLKTLPRPTRLKASIHTAKKDAK